MNVSKTAPRQKGLEAQPRTLVRGDLGMRVPPCTFSPFSGGAFNPYIIDARDPRPPEAKPEGAPEHLHALLWRYGPTLDKHQLAAILHLTVGTLENKIARGQCPVPVYRQGKRYLADLRDVCAYLDARRREAHP